MRRPAALAVVTVAASVLLLLRVLGTTADAARPHQQPRAEPTTTGAAARLGRPDAVAVPTDVDDAAASALAPPPPPSPSTIKAATSRPGWARSHTPRKSKVKLVIGLSKPVYRYDRERTYACPALGGGGCVFTTDRSRFGEAHAIIDVLKDPRRAAPLPFRVKAGQLKGVIISEKDEAKLWNSAFRANAYDFEVGYNRRTAEVWRPFMCNEVNRKVNTTIAQVLLRGDPRKHSPSSQGLNAGASDAWPRRTGELAAFVSNCAAGWRLEYMRELRKHVHLDSFGGCAHNNDTCPKSGKRKCDKVVMAGAYHFVFAFENTEESQYVTEKVYTGLRAGAVPIYKGAPEVLQHVPKTLSGGPSIILADSFGSPKALGEHLRSLLSDQSTYEAHRRWDLADFAKAETVEQCPWQCRVCEWVASRKKLLEGSDSL